MKSLAERMDTYAKVAVQIYADPIIGEILKIDPFARTILELASDPNPRANRWVSYEACKRMYKRLECQHRGALLPHYYDTMIWAVDSLLSISDGQGEITDPNILIDEWVANRPRTHSADEDFDW
jgi:hypothetical protein